MQICYSLISFVKPDIFGILERESMRRLIASSIVWAPLKVIVLVVSMINNMSISYRVLFALNARTSRSTRSELQYVEI